MSSNTLEELPPVTGATPTVLEAALTELGAPRFHSKQISAWVFQRGVEDWEAMSDLSRKLRAELASRLPVSSGSRVRSVETAADGTQKAAIELADGNTVEGVILRESARITFCISSQVGCAAGCRFCRSGLRGLRRNLTRAEIVEEVLHLRRRLRENERITNIVFMGIGEPLDNADNLIGALETLRAPWGLEISPRRVTVSTVGRVNRIRQLAESGIPVTLAISLHAGRQETRDRLVASGPRVPIDELVAEARAYADSTRRDVTFEYVLVGGVNDSVDEAEALVALVRGSHIHVNLIPLNPVAEIDLQPPPLPVQLAFRDILADAGIPVTMRKRKGDEISAACGQLASGEFMR